MIKHKKWLFSLLGILIFLWLWSMLSDKGSEKTHKRSYAYLSLKTLSEIEINEGDLTLVMQKEDNNQWYSQGYVIDQSQLSSLFKSIYALADKQLVTDKPEKHEIFEVLPSHRQLHFKNDKKTVFSLIVGKQGPLVQTTYVRMPDSSNVYLLNKDLLRFPPEIYPWKSRTITRFLTDRTPTFTIKTPETMLSMKKGPDDSWITDDATPTTVNEKIMSNFTQIWDFFDGQDVLLKSDLNLKDIGLSDPFYSIEFTTYKKQNIKFSISKEIQSAHFLYSSLHPSYIYKISPYTINKLSEFLNNAIFQEHNLLNQTKK